MDDGAGGYEVAWSDAVLRELEAATYQRWARDEDADSSCSQ